MPAWDVIMRAGNIARVTFWGHLRHRIRVEIPIQSLPQFALHGCMRLHVAELDAAHRDIKLFICGTSFAQGLYSGRRLCYDRITLTNKNRWNVERPLSARMVRFFSGPPTSSLL